MKKMMTCRLEEARKGVNTVVVVVVDDDDNEVKYARSGKRPPDSVEAGVQ